MRTLILLILITFNCFSQTESYVQSDSIISWNKNAELQWNDFLGEPDFSVFAYANTAYKIDFYPNEVLVDVNNDIVNYQNLNVIANFYKKHSWSISNDQGLLRHERLHFDIAELFARKIRKRFFELKSTSEKNYDVYFSEYQKLWAELRTFQKLYDKETKHGANIESNALWINKIQSLLNEFKSFAID